MNHSGIENLVSLVNSSILTPFNLIQYLKIDSYESLNITKSDETLIAKINFRVYGKVSSMFYIFNYEDKLLEIYNIDKDNKKSIIFNREKEVDKLLDTIVSVDEQNKNYIAY